MFLNSFTLALKAIVVAKLVIIGILFLTSFVLALKVVLVGKLLISGILSSIFLIVASYASFLTIPFFTTSLSLLKPTETDTNLSTSNSSTFYFKCLNYLVHFFNLSTSNLSTLDFRFTKSTCL